VPPGLFDNHSIIQFSKNNPEARGTRGCLFQKQLIDYAVTITVYSIF
jgi:hypothetical protein